MRLAPKLLLGPVLLALAACDPVATGPSVGDVKPQARPAVAVAPEPEPEPASAGPSEASLSLSRYYRTLQTNLAGQGLLRTNGGGTDTPFTDSMLVRNFERIALEEEYQRGAGLVPDRSGAGRIKKWTRPVRVAVEFGANVPEAQQPRDLSSTAAYVNRLARITRHPISMSTQNPNFHVLFMSEDDRDQLLSRVVQLVPEINRSSLSVFEDLPREIHCLVIAFSDAPGSYAYGQAIAVIRSEHPDLLRLSCIHEELAQGLGLANDSPAARPSIFNDDDEFALLTRHDEMLLSMLYDPRITPGMAPDDAIPIARTKAASLLGTAGPI